MDAKKFVQAYPHTLKPNKIHQGAHSRLIEEAQDWSYQFGRLLWALLHEDKPDTFTSHREFKDYATWLKGYRDLEMSLLGQGDEVSMRA
jgi:hypothetical protein